MAPVWLMCCIVFVLLSFGGWLFLQSWVFPHRLVRAERLWSARGTAHEVLALLAPCGLARGETGYRLQLLTSCARMALNQRSEALRASRRAHRFRLPIWKRLPASLFALLEPRLEVNHANRLALRLLRFIPDFPPLTHRLASCWVIAESLDVQKRGWEVLMASLPGIHDDPLLLEAVLLLSLERLQVSPGTRVQLGRQEWSPLVPFLFDETLSLLLNRHGHPRVTWNRVAPALFLHNQGRHREVIRLVQKLPLSLKPAALCEVEVAALRLVGDLRGARAAIQATLEEHPGSFRLWMENYLSAMGAGETKRALESLSMAERLLSHPDSFSQSVEWHLRRAEFAHWVEKAPERALEHLQALPEARRQENARFLLQIQVALEQYDEALALCRTLLERRPHDWELRLLQAECLAGVGAWDALPSLLEDLPESAQGRSTFWHLKGLAQAHLGNPVEAREALEVAIHMAPSDLRMVLDAGHAAMELGDYARAERHWRRALSLHPACEEAFIQLADTRKARQDTEGARRLLRECLLHHPESAEAQAFLAELEAN